MRAGSTFAVAAAALVCALIALGALAASATAKTIHVRAKQDNAISKAIDRAKVGDRLVVHKGTYDDPVVVDKRVRIVGRKKKHGRKSRKPVIAAGCGAETAVDVTADGAALRRLKIRGGEEYSLDISFVESGTARQLRLIDQCDALYGINVFNGGPIQILDNRASGYVDAGIYVGGITNTLGGELVISHNGSFGNNRGLIVENSLNDSVTIVVGLNRFNDNTLPGVGDPSGIFVHNSDGVIFSNNVVARNGAYGIHLDANSDSNLLFENVFTGNSVQNVLNQGSDNCGSGNSPNPFPPCP